MPPRNPAGSDDKMVRVIKREIVAVVRRYKDRGRATWLITTECGCWYFHYTKAANVYPPDRVECYKCEPPPMQRHADLRQAELVF